MNQIGQEREKVIQRERAIIEELKQRVNTLEELLQLERTQKEDLQAKLDGAATLMHLGKDSSLTQVTENFNTVINEMKLQHESECNQVEKERDRALRKVRQLEDNNRKVVDLILPTDVADKIREFIEPDEPDEGLQVNKTPTADWCEKF